MTCCIHTATQKNLSVEKATRKLISNPTFVLATRDHKLQQIHAAGMMQGPERNGKQSDAKRRHRSAQRPSTACTELKVATNEPGARPTQAASLPEHAHVMEKVWASGDSPAYASSMSTYRMSSQIEKCAMHRNADSVASLCNDKHELQAQHQKLAAAMRSNTAN